MTKPLGIALRRRPLLHLVLLVVLTAPSWLGRSGNPYPAEPEDGGSATSAETLAAGCGESPLALVLTAPVLPLGPAARGPGGAEQLVRSCEVLRLRTGHLLEVSTPSGDPTRIRAIEIVRIGFAREATFASTGNVSGQTTALPPPLSA